MPYVTVDDRYIKSFIQEKEIEQMQQTIDQAHEQLHNGTGLGNEYLGWLHYPKTIDKKQLKNIKIAAKTIQQHSDILIVIGVGGSYLGARAAIELLTHTFQNELPSTKRQVPKVIFAGHHLSGTYMHDLFELVEDKQISVNVISKSGSTTETAIAFRLVKQYMEKRYSKVEIQERIFITTGETDGPLKTLAEQENLKLFTIPDSIGGRYSVLTPVGLLPIAVSGISIKSIIEGAVLATKETMSNEISENSSYSYATLRYILYTKGKKLELFSAYEPRWHYFQQWWKQLFGESEGKNGKGLFPSVTSYSTDLHSIGQYVQEGERHLFQTVLFANEIEKDVTIPYDKNNIDGLNFMANCTMHELNEHAFKGALAAHTSGGVPNIVINIPKVNAFTFGYLVYFFQKACAISSYMLNVNPFNQPGVEAYKQNMISSITKKQNDDQFNKIVK